MFHVLDHSDIVYSGELSQATQYVIEHTGKNLDEAICSGIKILYTDALHGLNETKWAVLGRSQDYWNPIEDWQID